MPRYDPAYQDAMYNNRALVPEHPMLFQRWAGESESARRLNSRRLDLRYGSGPNETLDIFPSPRRDAPVLVFIHGGWFRALDKADHSFVAPPFVRRGATVVVPNYALCPAVSIEQIVMQMVLALQWTYRHIALYGGNPQRIVVAGHSAGGHLAAMMAACRWRAFDAALPDDLVKGAVAVSGLFELESVMHTPHLQGDLQLTPASVRRLSPAWMPAPAGPLLALVGALESAEFLRQNALIGQAWGPRTVPVCEALPERNHFTVLDDLTDPNARLHQAVCRLLKI
ncbi:MAG: alpha/beta hydrolase [Betaproteobacteria bacterium]|nr:alpha/beta hydrolase [Betaproteobacteria bacterium]